MTIKKAVIPVAGLGTRLLPATKEQPKEMLPIFRKSVNGRRFTQPVVQVVFEQLYDIGIRDFCFVIGRGKRAIEDHFTQDYSFTDRLRQKQKKDSAVELEKFYERLDASSISWINQPDPKGFGDAVLRTAPWVGEQDFVVHAGDAHIISQENRHLKRLISAFYTNEACAGFFVKKTKKPHAKGVVKAYPMGNATYQVKEAVEKPTRTSSNLAIEPVYVFRPTIFQCLKSTRPGVGNEIQLTDAIERLIRLGERIIAIELGVHEIRLDVGDPESYAEALKISYAQTS
jgi:UTP--glucose-1-phosphate uridylyltransferase